MTDYCSSCLYEDYDGAEEPCINCVRAKDKKPTEYFPKRPTKPITNGDLIRSFTDEQMAEWLAQSEFNRLDYFAGELQKHAHITVEYPKDEAKLTEKILEWLRVEASE